MSILTYILGSIVVVLLIWVVRTEQRLKKFFAGTKAQNFEELLNKIDKQLSQIKVAESELSSHLQTVDNRLNVSIRNIQTVRFNPFVDGGSNQSFAISLLNDKGDGVILSSLYARDRMSIFAKPITNGTSEFELTAEEKDVLNKSK